MWPPLYVALHPVRIHPGLLKMSRESPRESHVRTGRVLVLSFLQFIDKQFLNVPLHVLCTFFLYFDIIKDQLMEATNLKKSGHLFQILPTIAGFKEKSLKSLIINMLRFARPWIIHLKALSCCPRIARNSTAVKRLGQVFVLFHEISFTMK